MSALLPVGSPLLVSVLVALAFLLAWQALTPARGSRAVDTRLDGYVDSNELDERMAQPFVRRALVPMGHRILSTLGGMLPKRNLERLAQDLVYAGNPGKLSVLDFMGLRLLLTMGLAGGAYWLVHDSQPTMATVRLMLFAGLLGYLLPWLWLRRRVRQRQSTMRRALPDALDMLTIGVEAGLAFESALLRVAEQWQNPLTAEFRRAVVEMRMGTARNQALQRIVERTGVDELSTFVAVLIQSSQLGVSIAQVLNSQAAQMREIRRQRAEELARQATIKIVLVLALCIFPAMFVVLLGPSLPRIFEMLDSLGGG